MKIAMFDDDHGARTGVISGDEIVATGFDGRNSDLSAGWDKLAGTVAGAVQRGRRVPLVKGGGLTPVGTIEIPPL